MYSKTGLTTPAASGVVVAPKTRRLFFEDEEVEEDGEKVRISLLRRLLLGLPKAEEEESLSRELIEPSERTGELWPWKRRGSGSDGGVGVGEVGLGEREEMKVGSVIEKVVVVVTPTSGASSDGKSVEVGLRAP